MLVAPRLKTVSQHRNQLFCVLLGAGSQDLGVRISKPGSKCQEYKVWSQELIARNKEDGEKSQEEGSRNQEQVPVIGTWSRYKNTLFTKYKAEKQTV